MGHLSRLRACLLLTMLTIRGLPAPCCLLPCLHLPAEEGGGSGSDEAAGNKSPGNNSSGNDGSAGGRGGGSSGAGSGADDGGGGNTNTTATTADVATVAASGPEAAAAAGQAAANMHRQDAEPQMPQRRLHSLDDMSALLQDGVAVPPGKRTRSE